MALIETRFLHLRSLPSLAAVLASCLWLPIPRVVAAHAFVVDQHNDAVLTTQGFGLPGSPPVGQGFTPTMPRLDVVELYMNSQTLGAGGSAFVRIRSAGIAGPILGVSATEIVPAVTLPQSLIHFDFPAAVTLTPGMLYVIEVVGVSGNLGLFTSGFGNDSYPGGTAYFQGQPYPDPTDVWFREGPIDVSTPVAHASWGRVKSLYR